MQLIIKVSIEIDNFPVTLSLVDFKLKANTEKIRKDVNKQK